MNPAIIQAEGGTLLLVKTFPGARHNGIRGFRNGLLCVGVTQVAEKGKANKALVALLSKTLKISKRNIELVSGETNSEKRLLFTDIAAETLAAKINSVIGG